MRACQEARTEEFLSGLCEEGFTDRFLADVELRAAADRLGSTTHITAVDADGRCASVTCSNGTGSGVIVPGTGIHVNNMLGEEDLDALASRGYQLVHWQDRNLFFGGVHAVVRDPRTGELSGGGDPRRGGAVAYA